MGEEERSPDVSADVTEKASTEVSKSRVSDSPQKAEKPKGFMGHVTAHVNKVACGTFLHSWLCSKKDKEKPPLESGVGEKIEETPTQQETESSVMPAETKTESIEGALESGVGEKIEEKTPTEKEEESSVKPPFALPVMFQGQYQCKGSHPLTLQMKMTEWPSAMFVAKDKTCESTGTADGAYDSKRSKMTLHIEEMAAK